jgi:rubrerythrin
VFGEAGRLAERLQTSRSELYTRALAEFLAFWFSILLIATVCGYCLVRAIPAPRKLGALLCRRCGNDLRATPSRCPDCGASRA